MSFYKTFINETKDRLGGINKTTTSKYWCEDFPDPTNTSICFNKRYDLERWPQMMMFNLNSSVIANGLLDAMLDTWQPLCETHPFSPCAEGYQFRGDWPDINPKTGRFYHDTDSAMSHGGRSASFGILNHSINSVKAKLTFNEVENFLKFKLAPAMYKYTNSSYFNEAEYTLNPGQWEKRFWGKEIHCNLLKIKQTYDPNMNFACRHCVGSEVGTEPAA